MAGQPSKDPEPCVVLSIRAGRGGDGLRLAEHEQAVGPQRERERLECDPLERGREIDQDVPAEQKIDPRERDPSAQVVLAEDHLGAEGLADLEAARRAVEVAVPKLGGDVLDGARRVDAAPRERDRRLVHVGREDPDFDRSRGSALRLRDGHRQRVRLLPGRATSGPHTQRAIPGTRCGEQVGQDDIAQVIPQARVAPEAGDLDEDAADKTVVLGRVPFDEGRVCADITVTSGAHPRLEPTRDRRRLVRAEVDPAPIADPIEQLPHAGVSVAIAQSIRGFDQTRHHAADRAELGPGVDDRWRNGPGHRREHGGLRGLDHDRAAGPSDVPRSRRSVGPRTSQDDGDDPVAVDLRCRREQEVDRRRDRATARRAEPHAPLGDLDQPVGRDHEDPAVLEPRRRVDGVDGQLGMALEDLGQMARPPRVEVLGDDHGRGEIGRKVRHHARQRFDPAGRRADDDQSRAPVVPAGRLPSPHSRT